jgi:hypothetical protein
MLSSEDFFNTQLESAPVRTDSRDSDTALCAGGVVAGDSVSIRSESEAPIDYRIRQLSYSSLLTLHSCPRKFQLYKLRTSFREEQSLKSSITFAFGHFVGDAIQQVFMGLSYERILLSQFLKWSVDLYDEDERLKKSFWSAAIAIQRFISLRKSGFLDGYELVYYKDKPACELSFCINLPGDFRYRGHVDVVLRDVESGKVIVLEIKTTGMASTNPSMFKNSAQAIGYSIILDAIFPQWSSYEVLYLIYNTKLGEYLPIPFTKTHLQRALWIRELLLDVDTIESYESAEIYPMHGESCTSWGRDCEYINTCTLSTEYLTKSMTESQIDTVDYTVNISFADLLESQLSKTAESNT